MKHIVLPAVWLLLLGFSIKTCAQISSNVSLFGQIDTFPGRSSGSWGYVAADGSEYALIGEQGGTSVVAIDDPGQVAEISFIPGPASNWREITVMGDYAYVTTEGFTPQTGVQVISLASLPAGATLVNTYRTTITTAHIIGRDIYSQLPYIYVMGSEETGGVHILDVSDPVNPVEVGVYAPRYIHDAHIRGDRMFAAAVYQAEIDIVDISDRTNPQLISTIVDPGFLTHSCWTSADERHLIVTDEMDGLTAKIFNIEDVHDVQLVAEYTANPQSLVHNPYVLGDLVFFSHNTEGLRVVDIADPSLPVEVGFYDTYAGPSGGFSGLWSAFPYFPSGKIIGGNREDGLYIWEFNDTRAGRIYGEVRDSLSGAMIPNAVVTVLQSGQTVTGDDSGRFRIGELPSDSSGYTLQITAAGYRPRTTGGIVLAGEDSLALTVQMTSIFVALNENNTPPADGFFLEGNYPNPFNPVTNVEFGIRNSERVTLTIFSLLGHKVATLVNENKSPGIYTVIWDGTNDVGLPVASGVYIYRLQAGGFVQIRKMLLVR